MQKIVAVVGYVVAGVMALADKETWARAELHLAHPNQLSHVSYPRDNNFLVKEFRDWLSS